MEASGAVRARVNYAFNTICPRPADPADARQVLLIKFKISRSFFNAICDFQRWTAVVDLIDENLFTIFIFSIVRRWCIRGWRLASTRSMPRSPSTSTPTTSKPDNFCTAHNINFDPNINQRRSSNSQSSIKYSTQIYHQCNGTQMTL